MASAWGPAAASDAATAVKARTSFVREVQIDGLAVLKIAKHCKDALPSMVAGSLLGLDQKGVLEVTHSFPLPLAKTSEDGEGGASEAAADGHEYQMEMMQNLRDVNIDNNSVGWYQSVFLGTYNITNVIENQLQYQENLSDNTVVILYDPIQTANGTLTIKAFRLSEAFVKIQRERSNEFISPRAILEELPVRIRNPGLINALMFDLDRSKMISNCDFERLDLSTNPFLEKNLEYLCEWVDDLAQEQNKFQYYARAAARQKWKKRQENEERRQAGEAPLPEEPDLAWRMQNQPPRMQSLLIANQIDKYCSQMHHFAGASFGKLFLAGSLHKEVS